ncbi:MAG: Coenzyme F420 hydrogenase/dehydrogenase, beta subunit C-terminal domain [Candidatus Methanosuratincola petrocarbonis]
MIRDVVQSGLCTGCGTCAGICPKSAIEMRKDTFKGIYIPQLNIKKCNKCGLCAKVCPGFIVDLRELNLTLFRKEPNNYSMGNFINCYVGYATDYKIRYNSSSGGLVTSLLAFALKQGMIDGALVTKMSDKNPFEASGFLAKTEQELMYASRSKYLPVPVNIFLKKMLNEKGRFAVVGLPCHIHGIRKTQCFFENARSKIVFCFGLACRNTPTFDATEYILWNLGIDKQDVISINYRGCGWPGGMTITLRNSKRIFVPYKSQVYWGGALSLFFCPWRCSLCNDRVNTLADISFMDAWLPEFSKDYVGTSLVMSRSKSADKLILKAMEAGQIEVKKVQCNAVMQSQALEYAERTFAARYLIVKALGKRVPFYNKGIAVPKVYDFRDSILFLLRNYHFISEKDKYWKFISFYLHFLNRRFKR